MFKAAYALFKVYAIDLMQFDVLQALVQSFNPISMNWSGLSVAWVSIDFLSSLNIISIKYII